MSVSYTHLDVYKRQQYCFSHDNKTSPEGLDGGGFDFDGGITNSLMQYNLAMNNEGAEMCIRDSRYGDGRMPGQ